jgi:hypothetical protein
MSSPCARVHAFADGELAPGEIAAFHSHLGACERCGRALESIFALKALAESARARFAQPITRQLRAVAPRASVLRWLSVALAGSLALAATGVVLVGPRLGRQAPAVAWVTGETRSLEPRLGRREADVYRRYDQTRGGAGARAPTDYAALAELERRGDTRGLVSRCLLAGDVPQARGLLAAASARVDLDNERAVVALLEKKPEEALGLVERLLAREPRSPQALWNRALALRDMGLGYAAAAGFEQVAAVGEEGWSQEARTWARTLRTLTEQRQQRWKAALAEATRLGQAQALPSTAVVAAFPDLVREHLYNAVRTAPSARALEGLVPLARTLDQHYGDGPVLETTIARARRVDWRRRAPLAARYGELLERKWKDPAPGALEELEARLRKAGPAGRDLLLGLLIDGMAGKADKHEVARLAGETRDPWFGLIAVERTAGTSTESATAPERERQLGRAVEEAARHKLPFRRLRLDIFRAYLMLNEQRLREAAPLVHEIKASAEALGFWPLEVTGALLLVHVSSHSNEVAALRAYRDEVVLAGGTCTARRIVQGRLAGRLSNDGRLDEARRALADMGDCPDRPAREVTTGLAALSELARLDPRGKDADELRRTLAELLPKLPPHEALYASALEGRAFIDADRARGRRLLEDVIQRADGLPRGNLDAARPRALAYRRLIADAIRADELPRALRLMADEANLDLPAGCVLGVGEDLNKGMVVARAPDGRLLGRFGDPARVETAERLVPADIRQALAACPQVAVLALPPFHGKPRLLGPEVAWSHHAGAAPADSGGWSAERRLVISDVAPPASLDLPVLPAWDRGEAVFRHLRGPEANPANVLRALPEADLIEFHVHGLVDFASADASFLALSPDESKRSTLTAAEVRTLDLVRRPFVVLAACNSAASSPYYTSYAARWSLPDAFLHAGARAVLAATTPISDRGAGDFFTEITARIAGGAPAAVALRDARLAWAGRAGADWVRDIVLFQ